MASPKRDIAATRHFFAQAVTTARRPTEVTTDRAPAYPRVLDELVPEACHVMEQYANNPIEADHGHHVPGCCAVEAATSVGGSGQDRYAGCPASGPAAAPG